MAQNIQEILNALGKDKKRLQLYRGTNAAIDRLPKEDGALYFAYDTKKILLDKTIEQEDGTFRIQRIQMGVGSTDGGGSGGSGFIYLTSDDDEDIIKVNEDVDDLEDPNYYISETAFPSTLLSLPDEDTLLISPGGRFFRVIEQDGENSRVLAKIIASAGGGGSGGGSVVEDDLFLDFSSGWGSNYTYVYNQTNLLGITGTCTRGNNPEVTIGIKVLNSAGTIVHESNPIVTSGETYYFDTKILPQGKNLTIHVSLNSAASRMRNAAKPHYIFTNVTVVNMTLSKANNSAYYPLKGDTPERIYTHKIEFIPTGSSSIDETLHVYLDGGEEIITTTYTRSSDVDGKKVSIEIPRQSHGVHTIELQLTANINNIELASNIISYQCAWVTEGDKTPIVWIGNYDKTIVNYEYSYIEYMVYDPSLNVSDDGARVTLYKDGEEIGQVLVNYSNSDWLIWDITSLYTANTGTNIFSIECGGQKVDIPIEVTTEGSRNLSLAKSESLIVDYSAAGRSINEISSSRSIFKNAIDNTEAILRDFNWQNNGWKKDNEVDKYGVDNGSYLSISNGASLQIPMNNLLLGGETGYSVEMRFRIKNVKKYSTLVTTIPKYFYVDGNGTVSVTSETEDWIKEHHYQIAKDEDGNLEMDEAGLENILETEDGVVLKWLNNNNQGICVGTQQAYFATTSTSAANVRYCEDEVINLSFIITKELCYIYLNGILTGAIEMPDEEIVLNVPFEINSRYCDIDLFRFRIFQNALTMPDVIHNYLSDMHNIKLYDQNNLTRSLDDKELDFNKLEVYNYGDPDNDIPGHPGELTMPYAVWTIEKPSENDILPRYKGNNKLVTVDFYNPCLDEALENGDIDEWEYYTHSPSFHAEGVDINVQGTSSQKYPRRNFKLKYKKATSWVYTKGSLAGQSLSSSHEVIDKDGQTHTLNKKFHMDNYDLATDKFTWKIDYMESSGSYNTGFANLMGNDLYPFYTKHPLDDIGINAKAQNMRTTVYGYPVLTFQRFLNTNNNNGYDYRYIGRYNMNLDKSSNEYFGYELAQPQPYMEGNPLIKNVAECWELRDNQGTWCSFRFPEGVEDFSAPDASDETKLEVIKHFEYRYSNAEDQLDAAYEGNPFTDENGNPVGKDEINDYLRQKYTNLEDLFKWLNSTDTTSATNGGLSVEEQSVIYITSQDYSEMGVASSTPVMSYVPLSRSAIFDANTDYYLKDGDEYIRQDITDLNQYQAVSTLRANVIYYQKIEDEYSALLSEQIIDGDGFIQANEQNKFVLIGGEDPITIYEVYRPNYYISAVNYYRTTFQKDTADYRLMKFRDEFDKHLDLEFCLVYFILTELLLCYDSRGKNMMLASFGPHELGGDYIWYPIFYDIDTQLGLNNSGAYLWDYDADVTEQNLFSTPNSVLWNNFYEVFYDEIVQKYRVLRGIANPSAEDSKINGKLTYASIAGAYECDPKIFDSYAMQGIRPIVAIGLDEYYKYLAPTEEGFWPQDGDYDESQGMTKLQKYDYAYTCQGDKKLTTELLLRNRLNYIDSWWLGGNYTSNKVVGEIFIRANANQNGTSDTFLDSTIYNNSSENLSAAAQNRGFSLLDYNTDNFLDAKAGYQITPFLHQYVTYFVDNQPVAPIKYTGIGDQENGLHTNVSADVLTSYKKDLDVSQQINYIPAGDYVSSLGNLSLSYPNSIQIQKGKRLLDLNLGSDHPNYYNSLLNNQSDFTLVDMPLLQSANLSGLTSFNRAISLVASEKLTEFKALNSTLTGVTFAPGVPLEILLLPKTIAKLELKQAQELKGILTTAPVLMSEDPETHEYVHAERENYLGLYIENVTDYNSTLFNAGHSLNTLNIEGGNLGYGSYTILENLLKLKGYDADTDTSAQEPNGNLGINLLNVHWTPYTLVPKGSAYDPDHNSYYVLTDHSTYVAYNNYSQSDWENKILNEVIFTYDDSANKNAITNLNLLRLLVDEFDEKDGVANTINRFYGKKAVYATMPIISGDVFINNTTGDLVNEAELTSIYKVNKHYPNLRITAARVNEANITKYINILDSGKEETVDIIRSNSNNPEATDKVPTKTNYDFKGWGIMVNNELQQFISYENGEYVDMDEALSGYTFDGNSNILNLYAIFEVHSFKSEFYDKDGVLLETVYNPYSMTPGLQEPKIVPSYNPEGTPMTQTYKWLGWAKQKEPDKVINLSRIAPTSDMSFVAVFENESSSVYAEKNILDKKYLSIEYKANEGGYRIGSNENYKLTGKITLPVRIDDVEGNLPVVGIGTNRRTFSNPTTVTFNDQEINPTITGLNTAENLITHIFWSDINNCQMAIIDNYSFSRCVTLEYFEQSRTCARIGVQAFAYCWSLGKDNPTFLKELLNPVTKIGNQAFYDVPFTEIQLPGHAYEQFVDAVGAQAYSPFAGLRWATKLVIGGVDDPCQWSSMKDNQLRSTATGSNGVFANFATHTRDNYSSEDGGTKFEMEFYCAEDRDLVFNYILERNAVLADRVTLSWIS